MNNKSVGKFLPTVKNYTNSLKELQVNSRTLMESPVVKEGSSGKYCSRETKSESQDHTNNTCKLRTNYTRHNIIPRNFFI